MLGPYTEAQNYYFWTVLGPMFHDGTVMIQYSMIEPESRAKALGFDLAIADNREENGTIYKLGLPASSENGPFLWDMVVSFLFFHLRNDTAYERFLYGDEAKDLSLRGQYRLSYIQKGGDSWNFQQPEFTIDVPSDVRMDDDVELNVTWDRYIILSDPTLVHEWYVGDAETPFKISTVGPNTTIRLTEPGPINHVSYRYSIGLEDFRSDVTTLLVTNVWPRAVAGPNRTIDQDEPYKLDASASYDTVSDNDSLEYNWTIRGNSTGWLTEPTYEIDTSEIRKFTASLMVRDQHGKWTQAYVTIKIDNKPPEAILDEDKTSDEDKVVELKGLGIDTISHIDTLEFMWVFGDGTSSQWSSSNRTIHTYSRQGTYIITLRVKDAKGATNSTTMSITVINLAPIAGIDRPKDGAKVDMDSPVEFTCWSRDTETDNRSLWYFWDFGDSTTGGGADVSHSYKEAGRYKVTLTVEDDDGATFVVTHNLTIEAEPFPDGPVVFTVTIGLLAILVMAVVGAAETGKDSLGLLGAPVFTRSKEVLDNKTRHALHGVIVERPGINYTALREEFDLANGQAAYHLNVLEQESFIRSVRDGKLKRFYSAHTKVPEGMGRSPEEIREEIVELVRSRSGINQLEVMEELGLDRDAASYYLRELVKEGRLKAGKEGWYTVYTIKGHKRRPS
jgi:predicted transcriptional regulator